MGATRSGRHGDDWNHRCGAAFGARHFDPTPKDVGRAVQKGKGAGTLESGKWVGPVTSPITGEIVEVNEAVKAKPALLNEDPYGAGWFVRVKPTDWAGESTSLVTGEAGVAAYQKFLEEQNISFE